MTLYRAVDVWEGTGEVLTRFRIVEDLAQTTFAVVTVDLVRPVSADCERILKDQEVVFLEQLLTVGDLVFSKSVQAAIALHRSAFEGM